MDPEVVAQFNSLQQTGNYIPSGSTGPTAMSSINSSPTTSSSTASAPTMRSSSASATTVSTHPAPDQAALDALFALMGTQDGGLGLGP